MKWLSDVSTNPNAGDERYVAKFAFLPVYAWSMKDKVRYKVWLESYKQRQVYKETSKILQGVAVRYMKWQDIHNIIE